MRGVNKAILVATLGRDPEVRHTQAGDKVVTMSVATSESWKDKRSGEQKEQTEWHRVVIFGGAADIADRFLSKGDHVYIEGKLKTRKWTDQAGVERYSTEVVVQNFGGSIALLGGGGGGGGERSSGGTGRRDDADHDDLDSEIPF